MVNEFSYINKIELKNKDINEIKQMLFYSIIAFFLPFILKHQQIIVGIIVNTLLILGAKHISGKKLYLLIIMPSIGVFASGIVFGTLTNYLAYFLPLIWVGNTFLVMGYKYFRFELKLNKMKSVTLGIIGKVMILSISAVILVGLNIVPNVFLYAMSILQLVTAIGGAFVETGISKFFLK